MEPRELERLLKLASESVQESLESLPDLWTVWPKVPDRHVVHWYGLALSLLEHSVTALSLAAMCVERCVGRGVTVETGEGPVGVTVRATRQKN